MSILFNKYIKVLLSIIVILAVFMANAAKADVTYTLHLDGVEEGIKNTISNSVEEAVAIYNKYGSFNKHLHVYYSAGVPTAQANYDGVMTFGGSRNTRVALHEMGHTVGIGTIWEYYSSLMVNGVWQGSYGAAKAIEMGSEYSDGIHGDSVHCWPWGLNYDSEDGFYERIRHVRLMAAMRVDMGLVSGGITSYSKEPENTAVASGETATFSVECPVATGFRWYKDGAALNNNAKISGATTATLAIASVDFSDEGDYYCIANGPSESLKSRTRQLTLEKPVARWVFDSDLSDSWNSNYGTLNGSGASLAQGVIGEALSLNGSGYISLPEGVANGKDLTISAWVYWNGGSNWQRIFDFGTSTSQYLFLTPSSGSGTLRLAIKDGGAEQIVQANVALPTQRWYHLVAVIKDDTATMYADGVAFGSNENFTIDTFDFEPDHNYIGKSQFSSDPLFNGLIDDFRIYNYALSQDEVVALSAPLSFNENNFINANATELVEYTGNSLAMYVDSEASFSKVSGPDWLNVAPDGSLSGIPGNANVGDNVFIVRVENDADYNDTAEMQIVVDNTWSGTQGIIDLQGFASNWLLDDCTDTRACGGADLDGSSDVNLSDFGRLSHNWLGDESLQLHLVFNELNGSTVSDSSIYFRSGTLVNGPVLDASYIGDALSFDGIDDFVHVESYQGIGYSNARTVSAWIKTNEDLANVDTSVMTIASWGKPEINSMYAVIIDGSTGQLALSIYGPQVMGGPDLEDGFWHHIAVVLPSDSNNINQVKLYVDGSEVTTNASSLDAEINTILTEDVLIGGVDLDPAEGLNSQPMFLFKGMIDEFRIYDKDLNASDIENMATQAAN